MNLNLTSKKQPARLAIVDSRDLSRNGILMLLSRANIQVDAEADFADLNSALGYLENHFVHVLLLDDSLPRKADIGKVLRQLNEGYPSMAILVLSDKLSAKYVQHVIHNGAAGFIYKEDGLQEALPLGIETVRSGHIYISPQAAALPYMRSLQRPPEYLNHTDVEVLHLLAQGHTVQEIATKLALSEKSVYRIRTKLRAVLEVRTNEQIIMTAREKGLLNDI